MKTLRRAAIAAVGAAASLAIASSAGAVAIGFGDGINLSWDNLGGANAGDSFNTTIALNPSANFHNVSTKFNPLTSSDNDGATWATDFQFTLNNGYANIDTAAADTFLIDLTTGKTWLTNFFNQGAKGAGVQFTAPSGTVMNAGDTYTLRIGLLTPFVFNKPDHPATTIGQVNGVYSWSANWENSVTVPEPATWALMIGGFGLAGLALRRRRSVLA